MENSFNSDYYITMIKIVAIMYISIIYVISGLFLTYGLDNYLFFSKNIKINEKSIDKNNLFLIILQTCLIVGLLGVISYISRNLLQMIPFPLEGVHDFEYMRVKEVSSGILFDVILFGFSDTIIRKYKQIKYKLNII